MTNPRRIRIRQIVESLRGKLLAESDDGFLDLDRHRLGTLVRGRLERGWKAPLPSAAYRLISCCTSRGDAVVAGGLALGASLDDHGGDDQSGLVVEVVVEAVPLAVTAVRSSFSSA